MATSQGTVDFLLEQLTGAGEISARKMFGEYALYCDGKVVALVCDDRLFVKPTVPGRALAEAFGELVEAPPYPGAKPYFEILGEHWDEADQLTDLIRATADALPLPKPRKRRTTARRDAL